MILTSLFLLWANCSKWVIHIINDYPFFIPRNNWRTPVEKMLNKNVGASIANILKNEPIDDKSFYPKNTQIFNVFRFVDLDDVKVVIVLQDTNPDTFPQGIALSVSEGELVSDSLNNFYSEIERDLQVQMDYNNGNLLYLVKQGVLLLNTMIPVKSSDGLYHASSDWTNFSKYILNYLSRKKENIVFVFLGSDAKKLEKSVANSRNHKVIKSSHPAPESYLKGFRGSRIFSAINSYLRINNKPSIIWSNYN